MASDSAMRVLVIGAGPGGYPAAFHAADRGMAVTLVDLDVNPGGVCLYRGCIPSKTLLHLARLIHETRQAREWGLEFGPPSIDIDAVRDWQNGVVEKLTGGLGQLCRSRKVRFVQGRAVLTDAHHAEVQTAAGASETIEFDAAVIATGSLPVQLPLFPESAAVMDSTTALRLDDIPDTLLVVGGGYIGLELGTVYQALGSRVTVVEALKELLSGADRDLVDVLQQSLTGRFDEILLNTKVVEAAATDEGLRVKLVGLDLEQPERVFSKVLVSVGRRPNSAGIGLEAAGVEVDERGLIVVDKQRRTSAPHIYAVGDVAGQPMLAHKATYEAKVAVNAMAGDAAAYEPQAIPAVIFTDPELAWCGLTETQSQTDGTEVKITRFPWAASGRATTLGRTDGLTKLVLDPVTDRVLGMGIAGVGAGELIGEGVLAVEMGATAADINLTMHAHPTLSETVMEGAELVEGASTHYLSRR